MPYIHFALGKALEDVGDYHRAFEHLLTGNALKRREIDYDEASGSEPIPRDGNLRRRALRPLARERRSLAAPIFILGMPRSGSTLVEQILASHPQVHAAGELKNLARIRRGSFRLRRPATALFPACVRRSTRTACGGWARLIWPACRRCRRQDADHRQDAGQLFDASV